jgi:hypothetical protein
MPGVVVLLKEEGCRGHVTDTAGLPRMPQGGQQHTSSASRHDREEPVNQLKVV